MKTSDQLERLKNLSPSKRALLLKRLQEGLADTGQAATIPRRSGQSHAPLSFAQERLWFFEQLMPHTAVHNVPKAFFMTGELNEEALERSLNHILRRHEVLRSRFANLDTHPVQIVDHHARLRMNVVDLRQLDDHLREAVVKRLLSEEGQRPFDLVRGPVVRAMLARVGEQENVLVVTMHHIVTDGWSMGVFVEELRRMYEVEERGEQGVMEELGIQYGDYAEWQRGWLRGEVLEEQLRYWRKQLSELPVLDLPTDHPRPAVPSFKAGHEKFVIPGSLADALSVFGQMRDATPLMTFLAAFNALLYRYTGQDDIAVGTNMANRNRSETEGLIGFFVNMLVLRTDLSGNPTFRDLVGRVRRMALDAYDHQDLPFQKLVEELQPERDLSRTALFQVAFVMQNAPMPLLDMPGLKTRMRYVETEATQFDMILTLEKEDDSLVGRVDYKMDLFERSTILRLVGHFRQILESVVEDETSRLSELVILSHAERNQLIVEWNQSDRDYPRERCIHETFEAQVNRSPHAIAIVAGRERLTYHELNTRANQLGHYLRRLGVGPDVPVGICMDRSADMVVALLGVLKAGGAYIALDPSYPLERLAFMLTDAQIQILLTQECHLDRLPAQWLQVICIDSDWDAIALEGRHNLASDVCGENLAYVSYTSGSTGQPKGVGVCHRGVLRLLLNVEYVRLGERETLLQLSPIAFDASTFELWGALLHGGRCVLLDERIPTVDGLASVISKEAVTTMWLTASLYNTVIDEHPEALREVAQLLVGGEALSVEHICRGLDLLPSTAIINGYGPTESTTFTCCYDVPRETDARQRSIPIGKPIANTQVYILDESLQVVPVGIPGELHVGGDGLSRGYLNLPELTAEKFIPNPFGAKPGSRLYKTGDRVRYLPDGRIDFLGRLDSQVKIRGYRVEPGEVEAVLRQYPDVEQAAVIACGDKASEKRLVAYVVPVAGTQPDGSHLSSYLKERVPDHLVPSAFVILDFLPLTRNGKIDLSALPSPEESSSRSGPQFVAPRTKTEQALAAIWSQALGRNEVGINDNFFDVGGDSLRAILVVSMAKKAELSLSVQDLFLHPTVSELARELDLDESPTIERRQAEPFSLISALDRERLPEEVEDGYPLAKLQAGMLFHSEHDPGSSVYHDIFSFRIEAIFDEVALREALQGVAARHPVLRTSFDLTSYSEPIQLVHSHAAIPLCIEDIRHFSPAEQDERLAAFVERERRVAFSWDLAPLLRVRIHTRGDKSFQFTLSFHHAILDGWSLMSLLSELFQHYWSLIRKEPVAISAPHSLTYREFVAFERDATASEENRRFWIEKLNGSEVARIPRWVQSDQPHSHSVQALNKTISSGVFEALKRLAQDADVPLKSVLLAAHLRLLKLLSGQSDIVTGLVCNGRPETTDGDRVLGLFLNTLPLRVRLEGGTWRDLVRETFEAEKEMLPYRWFPLVELQKLTGGQPLFEATFTFVHFHVYERLECLKEFEIKLERHVAETNFPLLTSFVVDMETSALQLDLRYDASELTEEQMKLLASYYKKALEAMASDPLARYDFQCLLSERELDQILNEWNDTFKEYSLDKSIHQLFQEQVRETSLATAVEAKGRKLTYLELNERANQLAHHLMSKGIGPESRVGICVDRGIDMVAGLLGILKAGAAYVPLDPEYPPQRLTYMMDDSGVEVVITQSDLLETVASEEVSFVCLDRKWAEIASQPTINPDVRIEPDNLAYVIYTSGSTGLPKGVAIQHNSASAFLHWAAQEFGHLLGSVLATTSVCFDLSVFEIFAPLSVGGKVVVSQGPLAVTKEEAGEVRLINTVPSAIEEMARGGRIGAGVRGVNLAGEALRRRVVEQVYGESSVEEVRNLYGPSEYTTYATMREEKRGEEGEPTIGRGIWNTQVYVLDGEKRLVPMGVAGELYISGAGLARGYINKADQTAERFLPNPYSEEGGGRMYRTGDVCRYRESGEIEYIGRADNQVKVRGYRIELGEVEAALMRREGVRQAVVIVREEEQAGKRLVAYVVEEEGSEVMWAELRQELKQELPEYMVPAMYVKLEQMPLTPNGKIDRRGLPSPVAEGDEKRKGYVAPRTDAEQTMAEIWQGVLGIERVGVYDNFFELGGDSILSLQIVSRANQLGLRLTSKQLFQHGTIAGLESTVGTASPVEAEQDMVEGHVPLTPIQLWFFEKELAQFHHWNQSLLLEVLQPVDDALLERALLKILEHHDALRLRFVRNGAGWQQFNSEIRERSPLTAMDLSALSTRDKSETLKVAAASVQASLDLFNGPVLRAILFDYGLGETARLLIVAHHHVIDFVSWRILLEDLQNAYTQLKRGGPIRLPAKTTSFKKWAERLLSYADSPDVCREIDFWQAVSSAQTSRLPVDNETGLNTEASASTITVLLSLEETEALLRNVPSVYRTQINDLLLTALVQAFVNWTSIDSLLLDLEGHGREEIFDDVGLSRTVGWFTTISPVLLDIKGTTGPGDSIKMVKEQLRRMPNRGIGYGVLRHLSKDESVRAALRNMPEAEVSFNFLGQFDQLTPEGSLFALASEGSGPDRSPSDMRGHLIEVAGAIVAGKLEMMWTYSENIHNRSTIENLASEFVAALRGLILHCQMDEAGGYTPSDFPLSGLDQQELDRVVGTDRGIEDIYTLSPMQQGMLFHTLYGPESGMYFEQMLLTLKGDLNPVAFEQAWQQVVSLHAALRSAFFADGLRQPIQVVHGRAVMPLDFYDWRELSTDDRHDRLELFLSSERKRGFDLSRAPLMRAALIRMDTDTYEFVWNRHHVLMDGWSVPLVLRDVLDSYGELCEGQNIELKRCRPYRDYIAWLRQQDIDEARVFWQDRLGGFFAPVRLNIDDGTEISSGDLAGYSDEQSSLSREATVMLQSFARQHYLTLNTLVQGAWAILVSHYSGQEDVVFGSTVSGRPATIAGVESMVGLFINTLPVRVQVSPEEMLVPWLKKLQVHQTELWQYEYSPLVQVQAWSDVEPGSPLFESVIVFENYPVDLSFEEWGPALKITDSRLLSKTNYPLTVAALPGPQMELRISYDPARYAKSTIARIFEHIKNLMEGMVSSEHLRIADLPLLSQEEMHQVLFKWNETESEYESETCIHELFERQAKQRGQSLAIAYERERMSYSELNSRSNQLAHYLMRKGVGAESRVGICVERGIDMVAGLLGILKAGAAYVPLDPQYPRHRLTYMMEDSGVEVVITQSDLLEVIRSEGVEAVCVDREWAEIASQPSDDLRCGVTADNLAYVIYTSGSTGAPKGVLLQHRGLCNLVEAQIQAFHLSADSRALQFASLSFDASVSEIFTTLLSGAILWLRKPESLRPGPDLIQTLRDSCITTVTLPPSVLSALPDEDLPDLKTIISAGEACTQAALARWAPGRRFLNAYGPTETTVCATIAVCDDGKRRLTIGTPIANTRIFLLDANLNPVAIGVPGHLYIGGVGLARGYMNSPELTAESFVPNPFTSIKGERLYKSGDLARYLQNGEIEFLGRLDQQVKVRGYRIELEEIEMVLGGHPGVRGAVVLARTDQPGGARLVAYVVLDHEQPPAISDLRLYLKQQLPDYMLPSAFVMLEALPLLPNGKVDRKSVPELDRISAGAEEPFVAPRSPAEQTISQIWTELLHLERVGVYDNFFQLGGHSLLAIQVISRINGALDSELSIRCLFESPTIAELAEKIEQYQIENAGAAELADALQHLNALSDEEVKALLESEMEPKRANDLLPSEPADNLQTPS